MSPAQALHSSNHHNVVLRQWAKKAGISLGREGYAGYCLRVGRCGNLNAFFVEGRGPGIHPVSCVYSYLRKGRWCVGNSRQHRFTRAEAFVNALDLFLKLTGRDGPGKALTRNSNIGAPSP